MTGALAHAGTLAPGTVISWTYPTYTGTHRGTVDGQSGDMRLGNAGVRVIGCPCGQRVHRIARATGVTVVADIIDTATRDGVTVRRTWSEPVDSPTAYVVDQRCVECGTQVTDDDRGSFYDSATDDGTAHVCRPAAPVAR